MEPTLGLDIKYSSHSLSACQYISIHVSWLHKGCTVNVNPKTLPKTYELLLYKTAEHKCHNAADLYCLIFKEYILSYKMYST